MDFKKTGFLFIIFLIISSIVVVAATNNKTIDNRTKNNDNLSNDSTVLSYSHGSCSACSYTKDTVHKFENRCSLCEKKDALVYNPKETYEGEWTCIYCDCDFCAKCGKEKQSYSSVNLNEVKFFH